MALPIAALLGIGGKILDKIFPDPTERANAKAKLLELENQGELAEMNTSMQVLLTEMSGSWLQRNWRPITMLTFLVLVCCDSFGLLAFRLADQAWVLLQIGLGGYVVGRSVEKGIDGWKAK